MIPEISCDMCVSKFLTSESPDNLKQETLIEKQYESKDVLNHRSTDKHCHFGWWH